MPHSLSACPSHPLQLKIPLPFLHTPRHSISISRQKNEIQPKITEGIQKQPQTYSGLYLLLMNQYEPPDPDSTAYHTIAWICAPKEEHFCASRMLDEEFNGLEVAEDNNDNTYLYGRISKHYVVIGCLLAGRYGTNSASHVARDMVRMPVITG
jgi:hypothetical protein